MEGNELSNTLIAKQRKAQLLQLKLIRLTKQINDLSDLYDKTEDEFAVALRALPISPLDWRQLDENGLIKTGC